MPHFVHSHVDPEVPQGFFPPEVERWLYDNFFALQSSVRVSTVVTETFTIENTVAEVEVFNLHINANDMHVGESISMNFSGVYSNASASDDFTIRLYLNGALVHAIPRIGGNETDAGLHLHYQATLYTEGVSGTMGDGAILHDNGVSLTAADVAPHTVDTTQDLTFTMTMQWDNAKVGNIAILQQGSIMSLHQPKEQ